MTMKKNNIIKIVTAICIILYIILKNSVVFAENQHYGLITKILTAEGQADFETSIAVQNEIHVTGNISLNSSNPNAVLEPQLLIEGVNNARQACKSYIDTNNDGVIDSKDIFSWNSYIDRNGNCLYDTGDGLITTSKGNYATIGTADNTWFSNAFQYAERIANSKNVIKFSEVDWTKISESSEPIIVLVDEDIVNFAQTNDGDGRKLSDKVTFVSQSSDIDIIGSQLYGNFYAPHTTINISGSSVCGQVICDTWKVRNGAEVHMPEGDITPTPEPESEPEPMPNPNPKTGDSVFIELILICAPVCAFNKLFRSLK